MKKIFLIGLSNIFLIGVLRQVCQGQEQQKIPFENAAYAGDKGFSESAKVYFLTQHLGDIQIKLEVKAIEKVKFCVALDQVDKGYTVKTVKRKGIQDYSIVPVGSFHIDSIGYHFLSLKNLSEGKKLPHIISVIVSGKGAADLKFNNSIYRGAPATHLSYPFNKDTSIACFYSEIKVPEEAQSMNAYYMTNGFRGGYMGIQINSPTERRILFSIWSDYKTDDPKDIPADYAVSLIRKGENVHSGNFGNEGSGGQTYLQFNWKADTVYKLLVTAKADGNNTIYGGYFFAPEVGKWVLIGEWYKRKTDGKLLSGLYSFVENFGENGDDLFKAYYGNQWIKTTSGNWIELKQAKFSTTADPVKHPRFDYGGGVKGKWFYMFSGGFKKAGLTKPGDIYERDINDKAPVVEALP